MIRSLLNLRQLFERGQLVQLGVLFGAILLMAFLKVLGIASIFPFMQLAAQPNAIDDLEWANWLYTSFDFQSHRAFLTTVGMCVLALLAASNGLAVLKTWLQHNFAWSMAHRLSLRLVWTYATIPYEFFLWRNSADLIKKTVSEVNNLITGVLLAGTDFVAQVIVSTVILLLLMMVDLTLAFVVFGVLGALYVVIYLVQHAYLLRLGEERLEANYDRYKTFVEIISGIKAVKANVSQGYFLKRFEVASERFSTIHPKVQMISDAPGYFVETLVFGGLITVILSLLARQHDLVDALPKLSLYAFASYRLVPSLNSCFTTAAQIRHNTPVIDDILCDLRRGSRRSQHVGRQVRMPYEMAIRLEIESSNYGTDDVLKDIHITIPARTNVAFVGSTGSGKTTLVDILTGLLSLKHGRILIDGVRLTDENADQWRGNIGYVPQDVFLFDDTVARNIVFGLEDGEVDQERLQHAAKMAQIDEFIINELEKGYQTEIGERGVRLSGGQRQRMGIARALYRQPKLLLLDEATSALDGITEEAVIRAIQQRAPDLTVIMIAHRLSTVKTCDTIYLLENGSVVQHGSYEELFASNATFREMVKLTS